MFTLLEPPGVIFRPLSPPPRRRAHSTSPRSHSHDTADTPVVTQPTHANPHILSPAVSLSQYETESCYLNGQYMIEESASDSDLTDAESITDTDENQTEGKFYVIRVGHRPGVYSTRMEAVRQIVGFPGARFKSYHTKREAIADYRGFKCGRALHGTSIAMHRMPRKHL